MVWNVHIWKGPGVDQGFMDAALKSLDNHLNNQVNFSINANDEGNASSGLVNCGDDIGTLGNFEDWCRTNDKIRSGDHHMFIVDCVSFDSNYSGVYTSYTRGRQNHDKDTDNWGRSVVNAATNLLGEFRFTNTVIHEFSHSCMNESYCPDNGNEDGHSCGGLFEPDGFLSYPGVSPMLGGYVSELDRITPCTSTSTHSGYEYSPKITGCTKNALEDYHSNN